VRDFLGLLPAKKFYVEITVHTQGIESTMDVWSSHFKKSHVKKKKPKGRLASHLFGDYVYSGRRNFGGGGEEEEAMFKD
jgi:hypothetical protein